MTEAQIQRQIVDWLRAVLPRTYRAVAIPNASLRTRGGRASNAVPGLTPGVPDLMIVGDGSAFFLEVKTARGRLSDAQDEWANWCAVSGSMPWALVRSVDDARIAVEAWKIPTREAK